MNFRAPKIGDELNGVVKAPHSQTETWQIVYRALQRETWQTEGLFQPGFLKKCVYVKIPSNLSIFSTPLYPPADFN